MGALARVFSRAHLFVPIYFLAPATRANFQHFTSLCRICGDKIGDHKRKLDTNRFVSEIQQIWKDLLPLDSPNVHPQIKKKNKERRQISTVNDVFLCSLNTDNLGCILTLQVRKLTKKYQMCEVHVCCHHETRKINKFELLLNLVMMTESLILVL